MTRLEIDDALRILEGASNDDLERVAGIFDRNPSSLLRALATVVLRGRETGAFLNVLARLDSLNDSDWWPEKKFLRALNGGRG